MLRFWERSVRTHSDGTHLDQAISAGWGQPRIVGGLVAAAGLLVAFVVIERRAQAPLGDESVAAGRVVAAVRIDVAGPGRAASALGEVVHRFGRLDVLVNNAGRIVEADAVQTTADMNRGEGGRSVEDGARIIADLESVANGGPSGGFFNDQSAVPW